jgi:DNA modification methylase
MILQGDSGQVLKQFDDNTFGAVVTDPPYGLSYANEAWDETVPAADLWREVFRTLKPGAHLVAFSSSRTYHRLAHEIEAAGFEIRDQLLWLYGTGYPKNLDLSAAIDKLRHDEDEILQVTAWIREARDAAGLKNKAIDDAFGFTGMAAHWTSLNSQPQVPTLDQVPKLLELLNNPEVPAHIGHLLVDLNTRKGTPGENYGKREVVDSYKVKSTKNTSPALSRAYTGEATGEDIIYNVTTGHSPEAKAWQGWGTALKPSHEPIVLARKPFTGSTTRNVLKHGVGGLNIAGTRVNGATYPSNTIHNGLPVPWGRFFFCPKPSPAERGAGNNHPTLKPIQLMRYLCRLVCPEGETVLDPFTGSGTTGVAAVGEGLQFVGIELDENFAEIATARVENERARKAKNPTLF